MQDIERTDVGQFVKGVSGNPAGRPVGSKNLQKQLEEAIREYIAHPTRIKRVKRVIDQLLTKAEDGNVSAAKLLLDKIVPNAQPEQAGGSDAGSTYVFRIENATFGALPKPQPAAIDAEVIEEETPLSTGADKSAQFAHPGDGDASGGNSSGGTTMKAPNLYQPGNMMGKSGTPDNQDTSRPKGSN